jgi:hypothetical protein
MARKAKVLRVIALGIVGVLATVFVVAAVGLPRASADPAQTFTHTGLEQMYTVPADTPFVQIEAIGGTGGNNHGGVDSNGLGGAGADVVTTEPVIPAEVLYVEVGNDGSSSVSVTDAVGAGLGDGGGGGNGLFEGADGPAGSGGSASWVQTCSVGSGPGACLPSQSYFVAGKDPRLVVAGGGGGAGSDLGCSGGSAGGGTPTVPAAPDSPCEDALHGGGGGGTGGSGQNVGGTMSIEASGGGGASSSTAGLGGGGDDPADSGSGSDGGNGYVSGDPSTGGGGGGGGGYYGGGGGGATTTGVAGAGGGAGSSFTASPYGISVRNDTTGEPSITITPLTVTPTVTPTVTTTATVTATTTATATVTATSTATQTVTASPTATRTVISPVPGPTVTRTVTASPTATVTPSATSTPSSPPTYPVTLVAMAVDSPRSGKVHFEVTTNPVVVDDAVSYYYRSHHRWHLIGTTKTSRWGNARVTFSGPPHATWHVRAVVAADGAHTTDAYSRVEKIKIQA